MEDKSKKISVEKVEENLSDKEMAKVQGGIGCGGSVTPIKADNTKDGAIEAAFDQVKK